ncbi:MAG: CBS domain-containing protein [Candidatus Binatia bacterium]
MKTVRQLLELKDGEIWSIGPEASVYAAIELMAEKRIGALMVLDQGRPLGIVSERDYARKVILKGRASENTRVDEIMTRRVFHARPEHTLDECMALMTDKNIRHLPVMDDERLLGMLSLGDLVKAIIAEQQFTIEELEHYIRG